MSNLYTTGHVTLVAVPEPATAVIVSTSLLTLAIGGRLALPGASIFSSRFNSH